MIEAPTIGLVIDMMRKIASFCIGLRDSMSISPCASRCAMRPCRATSVTAPENVPASMWRWIRSLMRWRRSAERPTSSGRAVGVAAAMGQASTAPSMQNQRHESGGGMTGVSHIRSPRERDDTGNRPTRYDGARVRRCDGPVRRVRWSDGPWSDGPRVRKSEGPISALSDHRTVGLDLRTPHRRPVGPCGCSS